MKCKNCGAELIFRDGIGFCESCKNSYSLDYGFENTEVYICCKESNAQGGRTKDSIIAEELYKKLSNHKINIFCERQSAPTLFGDDLQAANYQAIYHSKIVLLVGTTSENFDFLLSKYNTYFGEKTVVPVYADVRPENLPHSLSRVQALNFNSIGAEADLLHRISILLGKEKEVDLKEIQRHSRKKKTIIACILSFFAIIAIIAISLLLFKESSSTKTPELTNQEIYENAQTLMESGNYLEAADLFATISDFKNSANLREEIFNRYDGYYLSNDESVSFYINIQNAETADIILEKSASGKLVRLEESSVLNDHTISASFTDSQNNVGKLNIELKDESIHLSTTVEQKNDELSIGNQDLTFQLVNKSDRPIEKSITSDTLIQWATNKTYLGSLSQAGYQVEFSKTMTAGGGINKHLASYQIKNTKISLLLADFDLARTSSYVDMEKNRLDDFYIVGIIAPASVAIPQKTGKTASIYEDNNILYIPKVQDFNLNSNIESLSPEYCVYFTFDEEDTSTAINGDTMVGITSKILIGENFDWVERELKKSSVESSAIAQFKDSHQKSSQEYAVMAWVEAMHQNISLICVKCNCPNCTNKYYYFKNDATTGETQLITELLSDNDYLQTDLWKNHPEFFKEFLE